MVLEVQVQAAFKSEADRIEATEEAIYNSLFRGKTVTGRGGRTVEAPPLERTLDILRKYNALKR